MDIAAFCAELHLDRTVREELAPRWEELTRSWDGKAPFFLNEEFFRIHYPPCHGPETETILPRVRRVLETLDRLPAAALLGHVLHQGAFVAAPAVALKTLPDPLPCFGEDTGVFSLMISLGAVPLMKQACRQRNIPEEYAVSAQKWFGGSMLQYAEAHKGVPGRDMQFSWLRNHVDGRLFRIGRLEYLMHPCPDWLPAVYRNEKGKLRALCRDGWGFRADGSRSDDPALIVRRTRFADDGAQICGTPIRPDGTVVFDRELVLDAREWLPLASAWDLCPSIHIPGGEPMPFEAVKSSLCQAKEFFLRYFRRRVPLFCCASWILNPAWQELLPRSNMAAFRRECYALTSLYWGPSAGMKFLFGRNDVPPTELEAHNSAQRAFQQAYRENRIVAGSLLVAADDVEKLGNACYRQEEND